MSDENCNDCRKLGKTCQGTPTGKVPGYCFEMKIKTPRKPDSSGSNSTVLLVRNLDHLMTLHAPEMCRKENVAAAKKVLEEAGGMLAFICDCKDLARKAH